MWTLENIVNGVSVGNKPLADWGLSDLRRSTPNLDAATVTLLADGRAFDAAELFPKGSTVIVRRDNERWFYGRVETWSRAGSGRAESQTAKLVNPWWYLAKKPFRQAYKSYDHTEVVAGVPTAVYNTKTTNRIFLNQEVNEFLTPTGNLLSVAEQIAGIIQWAIDAGAPIALGTIDGAEVFPPVDEVKNITCAEALVKQWRWVRDGVFFWDYTTEPYPTLHFRRAGNLPAVNLDLNAGGIGNGGELLENFTLEEKIIPPFVAIQYERTDNGRLRIEEDFYPDPLPAEQFGGIELVIDLQGENSSRTTVTLKTEPIAVASKEWWKNRVKWLAKDEIVSFEFVDKDGNPAVPVIFSTVKNDTTGEYDEYDAALTNELLPDGGSLPDWIAGVRGQSVSARGYVRVVQKNQSVSVSTQINYEFTATNAASGDYSNTEVAQSPDPIPIGLARQVFEANAKLAVSGSLVNVATELIGGIALGNVANFLTPAQPGWAAVRALVQNVDETVVDGKTSVQFGAPEALSANDLVDLLRVARQRQRNNSLFMRAGAARGGNVGLGKRTPAKNSQSGIPAYEKFTTSAPEAGGTGKIMSAGLAALNSAGVADPGVVLEKTDATGARQPNSNSMELRLSHMPPTPSGQTHEVKFRNFGTPTAPIYIPASATGALGGGGFAGIYDNTKAYPKGSIVRVESSQPISGVTPYRGVWGAVVDVPANGRAYQIPVWPEPVGPQLCWVLLTLPIQATSACQGGAKTVLINASEPY